MPPVCDLRCLRGSPCRSIDVGSSAIAAHNFHFWVSLYPLLNGCGAAFGQQIDHHMPLLIDDDRPIALSLAPRSGKGNGVAAIPSPKNCTGRFLYIRLKPFFPPVSPDAVSQHVCSGYELVG